MAMEISGTIWFWKGPAPHYFVTVPEKESGELKDILRSVTYGWGMIPVVARIGETEWTTSLFPKDGLYIVPIRLNVRKAEKIQEGDLVKVWLEVVQ
ncbi:MAG: DUF1905 domain-containing protein [Fimbriimonadaceae bacterium]|nr:DUF1905 domain-containing protein [Fimbriimonadaceae bacterium]